jgi:hypothetical protein
MVSVSSRSAKLCCPACVADKLEHEEKYDGRNCFVCTIYLKIFLRRSGILSILLLMIGPSVLDPIDCIQ